jgi:multidrug resistance efflux pump
MMASTSPPAGNQTVRNDTGSLDAAPAGDSPLGGAGRGRRPLERRLADRVQSLSLSHLPERPAWSVGRGVWLVVVALLGIGIWLGGQRWMRWRSSVSANLPVPGPTAAAPPQLPASPPVSPPLAGGAPPAALPSTGDVVLEAKGYIVPAHQILVSPKVSGMVIQLNVEEGRRVKKGDVLAVLESTDYAADYERAKATARLMREKLRELENGNRPEEILQAEAELREAEALVPQLKAEYERTLELRKKNSATQQELERAESQYQAQLQRVERLKQAWKLMQLGPRVERIEVARAELAQAEAEVLKAEWRLGNCTIRAPISGTILKKNAEEGNIVNPVAFNGSFSVCEMADLSDLEVDLNIQERDIARVRVGQKCRVRAEAFPERVYEGYVDRLMPIADRAKGALPVRVKIQVPPEEEGVYLRPEMGAIVTFLSQTATRTAQTPEESPSVARTPAAGPDSE